MPYESFLWRTPRSLRDFLLRVGAIALAALVVLGGAALVESARTPARPAPAADPRYDEASPQSPQLAPSTSETPGRP
jgi:hypothetical protein